MDTIGWIRGTVLGTGALLVVAGSSHAVAATNGCLVQGTRVVGPTSISVTDTGNPVDSTYPARQIVIEGQNFGSSPVVYFGSGMQPVSVAGVSQEGGVDAVTVDLPAGTQMGTYKIAVKNTTGPFLDNNPEVNPIFCFGSVTLNVKLTSP